MGTLANLVVSLSLKDDLTKGLSGVANKLNGVASDFRKVGGVLTAGVTLPLVALGTQLVSAASDLNESQSAVNTVFGDSAKVITDFSKTSATAMGISQSAYLGAASGLGALFTGMGLSDKTSANFSSNILQNASDLASFYNTDPGTALQDLQSGLVGEAEPLRKYGILLTEAAVQQKAMEQTGKANAKQLTESEKVTARYALIQEQLGAAQGDFARTSGGLANTQRILRAQLADTAAQMGQVLLPYVLQVANALKGLLTRFQGLSPGIQKVIVVVAMVAAALGPLLLIIGTMIPAITALGGAFAVLLGPIGLVIAALALLGLAYKTNFLGFGDAVDGAISKTKEFFKTFKKMYDLVSKTGKYGKVTSAFRALGFALADITGLNPKLIVDFFTGLGKAVDRPLQALKKMGEALGGIGKAIMSGDFRGALQQGRKFLAGFGDYLASPAKAIGQFLKGIQTGFAPLDNVLHTAGKLFTDFGRLVQEVFQGDLSGALDVAERMFGHLGDLGQQAWDLLKAGFDAINWGAVWDVVTSGISTAAGKAIDLLDWSINIGAPKLLGWIVDIAGNIWGWIKGKLGIGGGPAGDGTGGPEPGSSVSLGDWVLNTAVPSITGWLKDAASGVWEALKKAVAWEFTTAAQLGDWTLNTAVPSITGWLSDNKGDIWSALKTIVAFPIKVMASITEWTIDIAAPKITGWLWDNKGDIWTAVKTIVGFPEQVLGGLGNWVLNTIVPDVIGWIKDNAGDLWGAVKKIVGWPDAITGAFPSVTIDFGPLEAAFQPLLDLYKKAKEAYDFLTGLVPGGGGSSNLNGSDTGAAGSGSGSNWQNQPGVSGEINPQQAADDAGVTPLPLFNLQKQAQTLSDKLKTMPNIGTPLKVAAPDIAAFTTAMDTIGTLTGTMVGNVAALMGQNTRNIAQAMSDALSVASTYSSAIYTVASTNIGKLVGNTSALMGAFKNAVGQGFSDALSAAATYSAAVVNVTQSAFGQIPGIVASALSAAASTAFAYGANIGQSLAAGMASALGEIRATAAEMAAAAEQGVAARAKIGSPSKVFIGLGQYLGDGFVIGMENRYAAAARAGNGLAESAIPGIGGSNGGSMGRGRGGFTNYGTIRVESPSPEDFYDQWRQQQMGGVRR